MRWLVTGGAGFIGSHFVDLLDPRDVLVVDKLGYAADESRVPDGRLVVADIADAEAIREVFSSFQPDVVVNFAAESHVDRSYRQARTFIHSNIVGTVSLLEAVRDIVPDALFVQASTDEVYGDAQYMHTVADPINPKNPYAASKAAAEHFVCSYINSFRIRAMIVRSSNNWGPRQHHEKFIPAALRAKKTGQNMVVHGLHLKRDWLYVGDNVRAIYELIQRFLGGETHGRSWNVATGRQYTLAAVLDRIGGVPYVVSPERPGVDVGYWVCADATWDLLGWRPADFMEDERWDEYVAGTSEPPQAVRAVREAVPAVAHPGAG